MVVRFVGYQAICPGSLGLSPQDRSGSTGPDHLRLVVSKWHLMGAVQPLSLKCALSNYLHFRLSCGVYLQPIFKLLLSWNPDRPTSWPCHGAKIFLCDLLCSGNRALHFCILLVIDLVTQGKACGLGRCM